MGLVPQPWINVMTQDEKKFFRDIGTRVADLRKEQGLTQEGLAELLGVSQQSVAVYEVGRLRIALSMLPKLAKVLGMRVESLLGENEKPAKRGPTPKLQSQMERISQLPKTQQRFVMQMLDTVLAQASR